MQQAMHCVAGTLATPLARSAVTQRLAAPTQHVARRRSAQPSIATYMPPGYLSRASNMRARGRGTSPSTAIARQGGSVLPTRLDGRI